MRPFLAATLVCVDPRPLDPAFCGRRYDERLLQFKIAVVAIGDPEPTSSKPAFPISPFYFSRERLRRTAYRR